MLSTEILSIPKVETDESTVSEELRIKALIDEARHLRRRRWSAIGLITAIVTVLVLLSVTLTNPPAPPRHAPGTPSTPAKSIPIELAKGGKEILGETSRQLQAHFANSHVCQGAQCFGPTTSNSSEGRGPEFDGVGFYSGVAIQYSQRMPNNISVANGLALLRVNLPPDTVFTHVVRMYSHSGDWGDATGTSKSLGVKLSAFDPQGKFCVNLQSTQRSGDTTFAPSNVQSALVTAWVVGVDQGC